MEESKAVSNILRCYILLCRSLKRDKVFRSVMEMLHDCMDYGIDPMDFHEAIDYTHVALVKLNIAMRQY